MATTTNLTATIGLNAGLLIGANTVTSYVTGQGSQVGNVLGATVSLDADEVDVTPITSTGHRAFIPGPRSCTIAFELAFDQQNDDHNNLAQQWSTGGTNYYEVEMPNSLGSSFASNWAFKGFITNMGPGIDPSDKHGASLSIRCDSAPTIPSS